MSCVCLQFAVCSTLCGGCDDFQEITDPGGTTLHLFTEIFYGKFLCIT